MTSQLVELGLVETSRGWEYKGKYCQIEVLPIGTMAVREYSVQVRNRKTKHFVKIAQGQIGTVKKVVKALID